jgi:squalene-hopene/tetraprenyl-beta-curcumene cyclase
MSPGGSAALARERAVAFLLATRSRRGWWRDFDTLVGPSDEWITGYVGAVLARTGHPQARGAADEAWRRLRARRPWARGWGFNLKVSSDADSTIWALRLAEELGETGSWRARRAARGVARRIDPAGGVATYTAEGPLKLWTRAFRGASFEGWCTPQVCVTAAAGGLQSLPRRPDALRWLEARREPDGRWTAYWWCDDEYATALAVTALRSRPGTDELLDDAARWAAGRIGPDGMAASALDSVGRSAFATACAVEVMLAADRREHADIVDAAIGGLLAAQRHDGSWEPSAVLRIPPPSHVDPEEYDGYTVERRATGGLILDNFACYTTATVLSALLKAG